MTQTFSIGTVARRTGVKIPTIRYYEAIGLMPAPPRSVGNRRLYSGAHIRRLAFIRRARAMGFELSAIRTLTALQERPERSCAEATNIARARLADVRQRIAALSELEAQLERMTGKCAQGSVANCSVIEELARAA